MIFIFRIVLSPRTSLAYLSDSGAALPWRSFDFYIPHERLRPGGRISSQSVVLPHPWLLCATYTTEECYSHIIKLSFVYFHKLFCEYFTNRTARIYIDAIFTIQPVSIILTILFAQCIFSRPLHRLWTPKGLPLQLFCELIHHT